MNDLRRYSSKLPRRLFCRPREEIAQRIERLGFLFTFPNTDMDAPHREVCRSPHHANELVCPFQH